MKKRTLKEEIERIRTITYGKKVLVEDETIDKIIKNINPQTNAPVYDDPAKADYVDDNVMNFFNDLKSIDHPVTEQELGTMQYQKEVELVQMALVLLGYDLPIHGVDGLFGPETASAVRKYKSENNILSEEFIPGVDEMVWNKMPWGMDKGNKVDHIKWSGHDTHIHFGFTSPDTALKVIEKAQQLGLRASENPYTTGVDKSVHVGNSFHYNTFDGDFNGKKLGKGLDVSGDPKKMEELFSWVSTEIGNGQTVTMDSSYGSYELQSVPPEMIDSMVDQLETKGVTKQDLDDLVDKVSTGGGDVFTDLDLTTQEGFSKYEKICDLFISTRQPNPLQITGKMMANAAKEVFIYHHKYVPPELALSQLAAEGGIGNGNMKSTPIVTRNPYNVSNMDDGSKKTFQSVQDGIEAYYNLIARRYLGQGKTSNDLIYNFVDKNNQRYASAENYEDVLNSIAKSVNKLAKRI